MKLAFVVQPRRVVQKILVLLNVWPFEPLLRALYMLAVRRVLFKLSAHPGVHAIYGAGSYFNGGKPIFERA